MGVLPRFTHSWGSRHHFQAETDKTQVLRPLVSTFHHDKALHHAYSPTYWCFILSLLIHFTFSTPYKDKGLSLWPFRSLALSVLSLHSAHQDLTVSTISPRKESPTSTAPGLRREFRYCCLPQHFHWNAWHNPTTHFQFKLSQAKQLPLNFYTPKPTKASVY